MKLREDMVLAEIGDEYIAVSTGGAEAFHGVVRMNKTGAVIWKLIAEGKDREEIARELLNRYDGVDYDTALGEADKIISLLKEKGLLTE